MSDRPQVTIRPGDRVRKRYGWDMGRSGVVIGIEDGAAIVMWTPTLTYLRRQGRMTGESYSTASDSVSDGPYSLRDLGLCR